MAVTLNASTSTGYIQTADTSGDLALQSNGTTQFNVTSTGAYGQIKSGTAVTASGTSVDFTGIPSWVKRITVMLNVVSTNGTSNLLVQIGAGSITSSGYVSAASTGNAAVASTAGFVLTGAVTAATSQSGIVTIATLGSNVWVASGNTAYSNASSTNVSGGNVTLSGTLDRIRITTVNGTDAFDAGTINILYEG
jgi:hypothetical protein